MTKIPMYIKYVEKEYDEDGNVIGSKDPVAAGSSKTDILIKNGDAVYNSTNIIYIDTATTDIYITSMSQVPEQTEFKRYVMTLDCAKYTVGNVIVSGENVIDSYSYFNTYVDGYCILYTGKLGINKLVAKSTSGLIVDRKNNLVSGFNFNNLTVSKVVSLFENEVVYLRVYDAKNTMLKNTNKVTTGCTVRLIDASGNVIDSLTVVIRGDVNGVLEAARASKRIGKSLEAAVTLKVGDQAAKDAVDSISDMKLSDLFIVSQCLISDEAENGEAVVGTGSAIPGLTVSVIEAPGTKCPRCWMHSLQADPETGLCPRCAAVVATL